MIKFLKNLLGPKKLPIDQLLELTSPQYFYFWNGVNYCGEIMLTKDGAHPQHGKEYFKKGDYPTFFKIGFGKVYSGYGDWGCGCDQISEPLVEMFLDKSDYRITCIRVSNGFYNGDRPSKDLMKKVNKILQNVRVGSTFKTTNEEINMIIDYFVKDPNLTDEFRYACCIDHNGAEPGSINRFKRSIQYNIKYYKEKHPKYELSVDKEWLKEHPDVSFPEKIVFDTWEAMYARENELADGALHIPHECLHVEINKKW